MTRKLAARALALACLLGAVLCGGCGGGDGNVEPMRASLKARLTCAAFLSRTDVKAVFTEENADRVLAGLSKRTVQQLPAVETGCEKKREWTSLGATYTLTPPGGYENVVFYVHGGAWIYEIEASHVEFCGALADRLNARVVIPLYPLAPGYTAEDTYAMLLESYETFAEEGKPIFLMGDSAGGTLAFGLVYRLRERGLPLPEKLVSLHGCMDMTFSNPEIAESEKRDPMLAAYGCRACAELWAGDADLADPSMSPVCADLTGYPDTLLFTGTRDLLRPDTLKLFDRLTEAGVDAVLVDGKGLWHVFELFPIPEREKSLRRIEIFCLK